MTVKDVHVLGDFLKCSLILMLLMTWAGCSRDVPPTSDHVRQTDSQSAIIVIPGYYGTRLIRDSDGSLVFISLSEALFGNQALTLPIPGLGFKNTIQLRPDGILDEVRIIPLLYSLDIYQSLLERLRQSDKNREVIPFSYDWRGDLMEAVLRLDVLIRRLKDEGKQDISVVAHSMGGLIVSYYLRYGTQEIDSARETWRGADSLQRVIMAGVPFRGVMGTFLNMNFGATFGFNASLLTAEAYASFPASYFTLPVGALDRLYTPDLKPKPNIIRNSRNWQESQWGLLRSSSSIHESTFERRAAYMSYWLHRSQQFLDLVRASSDIPAPPNFSLFYIYGKGEPTLAKGVLMPNEDGKTTRLFFDGSENTPVLSSLNSDFFREDGDGTVTASSSGLPKAFFSTGHVTVNDYAIEHTDMVRSPQILEDMILFLDSP